MHETQEDRWQVHYPFNPDAVNYPALYADPYYDEHYTRAYKPEIHDLQARKWISKHESLNPTLFEMYMEKAWKDLNPERLGREFMEVIMLGLYERTMKDACAAIAIWMLRRGIPKHLHQSAFDALIGAKDSRPFADRVLPYLSDDVENCHSD